METLWQGKFLDGTLRITATPDPALIEFEVDTVDNHFLGALDCELLSTKFSSEQLVDRIVEGITQCYYQMLLEDREQFGETLQ